MAQLCKMSTEDVETLSAVVKLALLPREACSDWVR